MKLAWRSYKFIVLIVLAFLILLPLLVFAGYKTFYKATHGTISEPIIISSFSRTNTCLNNTTGNDYFIPTKTVGEWDAFNAYKPSGVTLVGCCGDFYCNSGNTGETYANCSTDCPSCGDNICNGTDTRANCSQDCQCSGASDCASGGCIGGTTCSGNVQNCSAYQSNITCTNSRCGSTQTSPNSTCGGGKNSTCSGGACSNTCVLYPGYGTADYPDGRLTDCGGCGSICTGGTTSGCAPLTNCYANGGSCTYGGTWLNGKCMYQTGSCSPGCSGGTPICYHHTCEYSGQRDCPAGYYGTNGSCYVCATGYYSTANYNEFASGTNGCQPCPVGSQCIYGVAIPCPSGMTSDGTSNNCYVKPGYNGTYS